MAEFAEVVRRRRMTRAFDSTRSTPPISNGSSTSPSRAPSAGKAQGWHLVVLEGDETAVFWDTTLPAVRRDSFRWQQLLERAGDRPAVRRLQGLHRPLRASPTRSQTGLGAGPDAWPVPYWTIDTSMSVMTLLLAAEDARSRRAVLRCVPRRARAPPAARDPTGPGAARCDGASATRRPVAATTPTRVAVRTAADARRPRSFTGGAGRGAGRQPCPVDP